jgi:hypothetical protein
MRDNLSRNEHSCRAPTEQQQRRGQQQTAAAAASNSNKVSDEDSSSSSSGRSRGAAVGLFDGVLHAHS